MTTSSFDKTFKISSKQSVKAIMKAMDQPKRAISVNKNIHEEIERGEVLLKRLYSR